MRKVLALILLAACSSEHADLFPSSPDAGTVASSGDGNTCGTMPSDNEADTLKASLPGSLVWWRYASEPHSMQDAMDCALERWYLATGLPIDISYQPQHWVRQDTAAGMNGKSGYAWTTDGWTTSRIKVDVALNDDAACQVLVHELGHVLRKSGGHPGPDGSMSHPVTRVTSIPRSKITQLDIDLVCDQRSPCLVSVPE
jgi:hypothetical protein